MPEYRVERISSDRVWVDGATYQRERGGCSTCDMEGSMCRIGTDYCGLGNMRRVQSTAGFGPYHAAWLEHKCCRDTEASAIAGAKPHWTPTVAFETTMEVLYLLRGAYNLRPGGVHKAVRHMLEKGYWPSSYQLLALEMPTLSDDGVRVAYCPNEAKRGGTRTVTTIGKYLRRHWPNVADHTIRDVSALYGPDKIILSNAVVDIVEAVQKGPYSCMKWDEVEDEVEDEDEDEGVMLYTPDDNNHSYKPCSAHPYHCYAPEFGWGIAVRKSATGEIMGRCLTNVQGDYKVFVRSYAKPEPGCRSETDQQIEAHLGELGFKRLNAWPEGTKLLRVENAYDDPILPYLDPAPDRRIEGGNRLSERRGYFVRDNEGEIEADCTDGTWSTIDTFYCDCCGSDCTGDSHITGNDETICDSCRTVDYVEARGDGGYRRLYLENQCVCVRGTYYHQDYLEDNDIVELHDGEYAKLDDTVFVESEDAYYSDDDVGSGRHTECPVVYAADEYRLRSECVWCESSGEWIPQEDARELAGDYGWVRVDEWVEYLDGCSASEVRSMLTAEDLEEYLEETERNLDEEGQEPVEAAPQEPVEVAPQEQMSVTGGLDLTSLVSSYLQEFPAMSIKQEVFSNR